MIEPNKPPIVKYNNGVPEFVIIFDSDGRGEYYNVSKFGREDHVRLIGELNELHPTK